MKLSHPQGEVVGDAAKPQSRRAGDWAEEMLEHLSSAYRNVILDLHPGLDLDLLVILHPKLSLKHSKLARS